MSSHDPALINGISESSTADDVQRLRDLVARLQQCQVADQKTIAALTEERDCDSKALYVAYKRLIPKETLVRWANEEDEGVALSIEELLKEIDPQPGK